nr:T-lymphocyte surface antigen Ly-9-like [Pelodiscus sinensis]|eukprot:XP_025038909.1 T-lymphocyte surface antigen Ly-9-like [Pelodiscus sinensis]
MGGALRPSLLWLLLVSQPVGCRETDVAAIAGESVQLQPVTWTESWVKISWEVTLDSGETYRLLTANKGEAPHLRSVLHFTSRVTFHPENLSLQIDPVNKSDRGLYTLEITAAGGRVDRTTFRVSVFERVRQPNLTVLSAHTQHGQCNLTLSCSVPGADAVTYSWSHGTSPIPPDRDQQLHGNQSLLRLVIDADSNETFYRCNASNRASWGENTVELQSVCGFPAPGAFGEESGPTRLNGAQGESVTFALVVPRGSRVDSVAWNGKSIIAIVTPGEPAPLRVIHTHYRDRLRVPDGSYSLQVTDLRPEDTGTYTAQIATQGSPDPIFRRFALRVYKRLAESDITVTPVLGSVNTVNGTCSITLNCTVQGAGEDVNCTWNQTEAGTVISTGASIHISHRLGDEGASVTCTARNPVSSSSRSVSLQDVCAGTDVPAGPSPTLTYCHVRGILLLVVLGALVTASVTVHVRTRDRERLD